MDDANVCDGLWTMDLYVMYYGWWICIWWVMDVYVMEYGCVCDISCAVCWYICDFFVCADGKQKTKKIAFSPLCRVPHSAKRALPSAVTMALGKAGKQRPNFPALPSGRAMALGKDFFLTKEKISLPSAAEVALGKEAVRVDVGFFLPSADVTLGKETFADGFFAECGTRQSLCRVQ